MALIHFKCPHCGEEGKIHESYAGKSVVCHKCHEGFMVGATSETQGVPAGTASPRSDTKGSALAGSGSRCAKCGGNEAVATYRFFHGSITEKKSRWEVSRTVTTTTYKVNGEGSARVCGQCIARRRRERVCLCLIWLGIGSPICFLVHRWLSPVEGKMEAGWWLLALFCLVILPVLLAPYFWLLEKDDELGSELAIDVCRLNLVHISDTFWTPSEFAHLQSGHTTGRPRGG